VRHGLGIPQDGRAEAYGQAIRDAPRPESLGYQESDAHPARRFSEAAAAGRSPLHPSRPGPGAENALHTRWYALAYQHVTPLGTEMRITGPAIA
jgi:hypothetical protein